MHKLRAFVSYSHEDERLADRFLQHLSPLTQSGIMDVWIDRRIRAGTEWKKELHSELDQAHIVFVLVSVSFLNSDYCRLEMNHALTRQESGQAIIVPIILDDAIWNDYLGKFQALPDGGRPVTDFNPHDRGFAQAAREIRSVVEELLESMRSNSAQAPKPKTPVDINMIRESQKAVLEWLNNVELVVTGGDRVLRRNKSDLRYKQALEAIRTERVKVQSPELIMSVVAPMKAGKSTVINTITGGALLPSRNTAMTSIPTEVALASGYQEPVLVLSKALVDSFHRAERQIGKHLKKNDRDIAELPELKDFASHLIDGTLAPLQEQTRGEQDITRTLMRLNDVVRLFRVVSPADNPLLSLESVPRLEASLWNAPGVEYPEMIGKLVIIDTPGPDEAGAGSYLYGVVKRQLQRSSLVLLIMNYAALRGEGDQRIREEVRRVPQLTRPESVYVLVNKIDQRGEPPEHLTKEQTALAAINGAGLGDPKARSRVFEISALHGLTSVQFFQRADPGPGGFAADATTRALLRQCYGRHWERIAQTITPEELQKLAGDLWNDSGFPEFLSSAIAFLAQEVAATEIRGSLKRTEEILSGVRDDALLRQNALSETVAQIGDELAALEKDLKEVRRGELKYRPAVPKAKLKRQVSAMLEKVSAAAMQEVAKELDRLVQAVRGKATNKGMELPWIAAVRNELQSAGERKLDFRTKEAAETFSKRSVVYVAGIIQPFFARATDEATKALKDLRSQLLNGIQRSTEPVISRMRERIDNGFRVRRSLPAFRPIELGDLLDLAPPAIAETAEMIEEPPEEVVLFRLLWIIPVKKLVQQPARTQRHFTVDLGCLRAETEKIIQQNFKKLSAKIDFYLDRQLRRAIDDLSEHLNQHFENYRTNLEQAKQDHQLTREEQESKQIEIGNLATDASRLLERCKQLRRRNELASRQI